MTTKTLDNSTSASDPGNVRLSEAKLKLLQPELLSRFKWLWAVWRGRVDSIPRRPFMLTHVAEHLMHGDSRAAMVVSTAPLRIAAFTSELDCVVMLAFDQAYVERYQLKPGTRLLTVNTYSRISAGVAADLTLGPGHYGRWGNLAPYIAEFLSNDMDRIEARKAAIEEGEWQRLAVLAEERVDRHDLLARDGRPLHCAKAVTAPA